MKQDYAGSYLKGYRAPFFSVNTILNSVLTKPVVHKPSAIITREVQFPDASFYQKEIDFETMRQYTKAIIIRAGQNLWIDKQFERNYTEAKRVGLYVGAYWFYDGRVSPGSQADLLITLLQNKTLEMEVFIDWEHNYGGSHEGLKNVVAMMERVEAAGLRVKSVGLYTGYYFFRANSNPISNSSQYNYLKNKPLWLAWYTNNPSLVLIPEPWSYLTHWQFGTPIVVWGQQTAELDMNFHNGSAQNFHSRYGGSEPQNRETMQVIKGTALTSVRRRSAPNTSDTSIFNPARYLVMGDKIEAVYPNQSQWLKLTKINGVPVIGEEWASAGSMKQYIEWWVETVPEEPPPPDPTNPDYIIVHWANGQTKRYVPE